MRRRLVYDGLELVGPRGLLRLLPNGTRRDKAAKHRPLVEAQPPRHDLKAILALHDVAGLEDIAVVESGSRIPEHLLATTVQHLVKSPREASLTRQQSSSVVLVEAAHDLLQR